MELEQLLQTKWKRDSDTDCEEKLIEYMNSHESIAEENLTFIRLFSYRAQMLLKNKPGKLDGLVEKLNRFNCESIKLVEQNKGELNNTDRSFNIALLSSYAADTSWHLFKSTKQEKYAEQTYHMNIDSAILMESIDEKRAAYAYSFAGNGAREMYKITKNIEWAIKLYEANYYGACLLEKFDKHHAAYTFGFASDGARAVFFSELSGPKAEEYGIKWYECAIRSARLSEDFDLHHAAYSYGFSGDAARKMHGLTRESKWLMHWYEGYLSSADLVMNDIKHKASALSIASEAARLLFLKTKNIEWAKGRYDMLFESASLFETIDDYNSRRAFEMAAKAARTIFGHSNDREKKIELAMQWYNSDIKASSHCLDGEAKHYAHDIGYAGDASYELYKLTGQIDWAKKAIDGWNVLINYYKNNPEPQFESLLVDKENALKSLEQKIL